MNSLVLLTGATGFTGSYVVPLLLEGNYRVRCLVRKGSSRAVLPLDRVELAFGDLDDPASLSDAFQNVDSLVNVASLGFGHAPAIVSAAKNAGVRRCVFISTTAVSTTLNAPSKTVRLKAESTIHESGLAYTILRPTMIYGSSRDRNISRLIRYLNQWPVIPVFGDGRSLQQPVYVGDVAAAAVYSLESEVAIGETYNISGAEPITYNELIDVICGLLRRRVRKVHLPAAPVISALKGLDRLPFRFPIKSEQIQRLNEDKAFDHRAAARDLGYQPRTVVNGLRQELIEMGLLREGN
jgi:nucleoside-diphosphate-sugar epimerase